MKKLEDAELQVHGAAPTCPFWLDGVAKKEWYQVARELARLRLLTELDRTALAGYCQSFSTLRMAQLELRKGLTFTFTDRAGEVKRATKPEVKIAHDRTAPARPSAQAARTCATRSAV